MQTEKIIGVYFICFRIRVMKYYNAITFGFILLDCLDLIPIATSGYMQEVRIGQNKARK